MAPLCVAKRAGRLARADSANCPKRLSAVLLLLLAAVKWIFLLWLGLCVVSGLGLGLITLWQGLIARRGAVRLGAKQMDKAPERARKSEPV
jgi:hypothetical protein